MKARRTKVRVTFAGTEITEDITPYLRSLTYVDNEEDTADDLTISLIDKPSRNGVKTTGGVWLREWAGEAMRMSAQNRRIAASIVMEGWDGEGEGRVLDCGDFELDDVSFSGFPVTLSLKATSLPYASAIRQTVKSRAWEDYTLSGIAGEVAAKAGMTAMYEASDDPHFEREEQYKESDIKFLARLCHDHGISLKATDKMLVLFSQADYEAADSIAEITFGDRGIESFSLSTEEKGTQYQACSVSYTDPETGEAITARVEDPDGKTEQELKLTERVDNIGDALRLAAAKMRYYNKFAKTASFTLAGNPALLAGMNVTLKEFGEFSGKYAISRAVHSVGDGGYTTQITLRNIITRY